ncbi:prepilin peptidase [Azospirillum sp. Sh1]|nr:prepilin peptidase [Azospirillum sp. Sh1]
MAHGQEDFSRPVGEGPVLGLDIWIGLGVLGLMVGSFLNVVIHRLPIMIDRADGSAERYDLVLPPSGCPACGRRLRIRDNVPLLSFALLRGRCAGCGTRISWRYPLVEALGAALPLAVAPAFGDPMQAAAAAVFSWFAIAILFIDAETQLIPDALSLPLLWIGLLLGAGGVFVGAPAAILGAAAGYGALRLLGWVAQTALGRPALGAGDVKLFAALGAWLGWQPLPATLFLACLTGTLAAAILALFGRRSGQAPIAFGPFLIAAGLLMLAFGQHLRPILGPLFLR